MYNVHGFGKRIASYRKLAGLTQEELAARLHVTPQAVSKWENELCFPEITILPQLAQELNTTIEKLFGNSENLAEGAGYPEAKGKLKLVHTFQNVACYSDKEVDVNTAEVVAFKDGSWADLRKLEISNKGPGDICFDFADGSSRSADFEQAKTELEQAFSGITALSLSISNVNFTVKRSGDETTRLKATGTASFIANLEVRQNGGQLQVAERGSNMQAGDKNRIDILFGQDTGAELAVKINGAGNGMVEVPFRQAQVGISGAGDLDLDDVEQLYCKISGSGDVTAKRVGRAELAISGAGDIEFGEIHGDLLDAQISGAGDIRIKSGEVGMFKARVSGAGDIDTKGVTARTADLNCRGASNIVLGRVVEESIEKHSKFASIKILERG